jgi:hypothetical protein
MARRLWSLHRQPLGRRPDRTLCAALTRASRIRGPTPRLGRMFRRARKTIKRPTTTSLVRAGGLCGRRPFRSDFSRESLSRRI